MSNETLFGDHQNRPRQQHFHRQTENLEITTIFVKYQSASQPVETDLQKGDVARNTKG